MTRKKSMSNENRYRKIKYTQKVQELNKCSGKKGGEERSKKGTTKEITSVKREQTRYTGQGRGGRGEERRRTIITTNKKERHLR